MYKLHHTARLLRNNSFQKIYNNQCTNLTLSNCFRTIYLYHNFSTSTNQYRDEFNKILQEHNNSLVEDGDLEKEAKRISSFLNEDVSSLILPKTITSQSNINTMGNNNTASLWNQKEANECDAYNQAKEQFDTLLDPDTDDPLNDRGRNFTRYDYTNRYQNNRYTNNNHYNNPNVVPNEYKNQMKLKKQLSDPKVQESMLLNNYLEQPMIYGPEYMKGKSRIEVSDHLLYKSILNEMPRRRALEAIYERRLGLTRFFNRLMDEPPYATRQGSYFRNEAMNRSWPRIANRKDKQNPYVEKWDLNKLLESVDVVVEDRIIPDHPQEEMNLSNRFDDYALIDEGRDNFMKGKSIEVNNEEKTQLRENPFDYKSDIEIGEYSSDGIVTEPEQPGGYNPLIMKRDYRYKWPRFKKDEIGEKPYEGFSDSELKERVVEIMPNVYFFKDDPKRKYYEYRDGRFHLLDKKILKSSINPEVEYNNSLMATSDEYGSDLEPTPPHQFYSRDYNRTEKSLIPRAVGQFLDGLKQLDHNEEVDNNTKEEIRMYMENSLIKTIKQNKLEFADFCDNDIPNKEGIYSEPLDENDMSNGKLPSNLPKSRLWKLLGPKFTKIAERHYNLSPSEKVELELPKVRNLPLDQQEIYNSSKYSFYNRNRKSDYQKFYERDDEDFLIQDYSLSEYKQKFGSKATEEFKQDNENNQNNNDRNNNENESQTSPIFGENTFSFYQSRVLKYPNNSLFGSSAFNPSPVLLDKKRFDLFDSLDVLLPSDEENRFHDDYSNDEIHMNSSVEPANFSEILKNSNLSNEELIKIVKEYPKYKKMNLSDKEAMNVLNGILPDQSKYRYNPYSVPEDAEGILKPPNGVDPKLFRAMTLFQTRHNHKIYDEKEEEDNNNKDVNGKDNKRKKIEKVEMLSSESDTDFDPNDNIENPMNEVFNWRKKKEPNIYAKDIAESPDRSTGQSGSVSFVLDQKQVQHTTKGGRSALAVVLGIAGNLEGCVGYGYGRARDVTKARTKALVFARNNYVGCDLYEGRTLYHEVSGKYNSTKVLIKPAAPATGIIACDSLWAILFCLGIKDAVTKVSGNRNIYSLVNATFAALDKHQSVWDVSRIRGQRIRDMRYSHLWNRSKLRDAEKKYGLDPHRF